MNTLPTTTKLRADLVKIARGMRKSVIPLSQSLTQPQSVRDDHIILGGKMLKRKRIVLLAPACSTATCTMCPLPNEAIDINHRAFDQDNLIRQFDASFSELSIHSYDVVTIYCNGNFFADREISPKIRQHIYTSIRDSSASYLIVESLPNFINEKHIKTAREDLGKKTLVVSMGLQSANDTVRELAVNTVCTKKMFEEAVFLLRKYNFVPLVFLMIKPPFLTEKETIVDCVESWKYLVDMGIEEITFSPTKVTRNTIAALLFNMKQYRPPWLWTVIQVLTNIEALQAGHMPVIATSVLRKSIYDIECASNCQKCTDDIIRKLDDYNMTRQVRSLDHDHCECVDEYTKSLVEEHNIYKRQSIEQRISQFIQTQNV